MNKRSGNTMPKDNEDRVELYLFKHYKKISKLYEIAPGQWSKSPVVGNFNAGFFHSRGYVYPQVVTVTAVNPKVIYVVQF